MADIVRARATILGVTGLPGLFTAYFAPTGSVSTAVATEALGRVRAFWEGFRSHLPGTCTVQYTPQVDVLNDASGALTARVAGSVGATTICTGAGTAGSAPAMFVAQYLTGVVINGRVVRGRAFIGPTLASDNSAGAPTAASITALQTAVALLGTTIVTPLSHAVWHRPGPGGSPPGATVLVSGYSVWGQWGVLRSRRD